MGKVLGDERAVRHLEERRVLVAVQVERTHDRHVGPDDLPEAARDLGLGPRDVPHGHGAMQREVDAVDRHRRAEVRQHQLDEVIERLFRGPRAGGAAEGFVRGRQADELDVAELARHLHEPGHIRVVVVQQLVAAKCRPDARPVVDAHVATRAERARLVLEARDRHLEGAVRA